MGYFDDQQRLAAAGRGHRAIQEEKRLAGPELPLFEDDPEGAEEGSKWVKKNPDGNPPRPQITVQIDGETYRAELYREGEVPRSAVEDAAPVGCGKEWFGANDPPGGKWMIRNGRVLEQAEYPELFAVIGTIYNTGGEGPTQFRIPDSRGRAGVGAGQGPGLTNRPLGSRFGAEEHTLGVTEMPGHSHSASTGNDSHSHGGATGSAGGHDHGGSTEAAGAHSHNYTAHTILAQNLQAGGNADDFHQGSEQRATDAQAAHSHGIPSHAGHDHSISQNTHNHTVSVGSVGGNNPHPNVQPSIAENYIIRVKP